jgi:hypothetical protein
LTTEIYKDDYTDGGIDYQTDKRTEVAKEVALRQAFGFEDGFVNAVLAKKNNNEVKNYFARTVYGIVADPRDFLEPYTTPQTLLGEKYALMSDELEKDLEELARAPQEWHDKIIALSEKEVTDETRLAVIAGDLQFAKKAYKDYGLISKEFYESLTNE